MATIEKVIIYITRTSARGDELLVFDHRDEPDAGTQVPAGTVDPGESFAVAAVRELHEESGLANIPLNGPIDAYDWLNPTTGNLHVRQVYHAAVSGLPDAWHHEVHGGGDDAGRVFVYRWIALADAVDGLAGHQGRSIAKLPTSPMLEARH